MVCSLLVWSKECTNFKLIPNRQTLLVITFFLSLNLNLPARISTDSLTHILYAQCELYIYLSILSTKFPCERREPAPAVTLNYGNERAGGGFGVLVKTSGSASAFVAIRKCL